MITSHQYRNDSQQNGPCTWKYHVTPCGRPREDHSESACTVRLREHVGMRRAFILHVDLDPVPGSFHTPRSANEHIQAILDRIIPHYTPVVVFGVAHPDEVSRYGRKRVCFVIFVDLDPIRGAFHTEASARITLRAIFNNIIPHYDPLVTLAPADIQPENIARGVRV